MKILFISDCSIAKGSNRIWVRDMGAHFSELGHSIETQLEAKAGDYDVVIFAKGHFSVEAVKRARTNNPLCVIGWINATVNPLDTIDSERSKYSCLDFFVVGSIEERDSLLPYMENILIFPLIETMYKKKKTHSNQSTITLGYHGNGVHLEEFFPHVTKAIEALSNEMSLKLIAVHAPEKNWEWTKGKPNIEVEQIAWELETVEDNLLRCDIGLVPGITPIQRDSQMDFFNKSKAIASEEISGYDTDYLLRFKNKSNAGRSFVFHQLHIPVVAAFMPSHFHILGNQDCGYLAHSQEGWLDGIRALAQSTDKRAAVAKAAFMEFERLYNPVDWAQRCLTQIKLLKEEKEVLV